MSLRNVKQLQPTKVTYKDHTITLKHRPKINDWQYHIKHTRTINIVNQAPRYDTALRAAKSDIDTLVGDER